MFLGFCVRFNQFFHLYSAFVFKYLFYLAHNQYCYSNIFWIVFCIRIWILSLSCIRIRLRIMFLGIRANEPSLPVRYFNFSIQLYFYQWWIHCEILSFFQVKTKTLQFAIITDCHTKPSSAQQFCAFFKKLIYSSSYLSTPNIQLSVD